MVVENCPCPYVSTSFADELKRVTGISLHFSIPDGNCFFHSIESCISKTEELLPLKERVQRELKEKRNDYSDDEIGKLGKEFGVLFACFRLREYNEDVFYPGIDGVMTNSYENKKEPSSTDYNFKEKMIVILMGDQKFRNEGKYYVVPIFQFLDHKDKTKVKWCHFDGISFDNRERFNRFWSEVGLESLEDETSSYGFNHVNNKIVWLESQTRRIDRQPVDFPAASFKMICDLVINHSSSSSEDFIPNRVMRKQKRIRNIGDVVNKKKQKQKKR